MEQSKLYSCVIDTSVWVALFLDADTNHNKAVDFFNHLPEKVYIPYVVVVEAATVLAYKHSKRQADQFLRFISEDERCSILIGDGESEISAFISIPDTISFADVSIISTALRFQTVLFTFDTQMEKVHKRLVAKSD